MWFGLPVVVAAHLVGIVAADHAWPVLSRPAAYALALAGSVLLVGLPRPGRPALVLVLAFAAGFASLAGRLDASARFAPVGSRDLVIEARVCGGERNGRRRSLELCGSAEVEWAVPRSTSGERRRLPDRLVAQYRASAPEAGVLDALDPGDRIRARVRVEPLGGTRNPGRPNPERRWQRRGVGGRARFIEPDLVVVLRRGETPSARVSWGLSLASGLRDLRTRIAAGLTAPLPGGWKLAGGESGELLAALAVGHRDGLAARTRDAFARLGVAHLLAISGLHLALAAGLIFALARSCLGWAGDFGRDPRPVALLLAGVGAAGYALLAGFGIPVQRALCFVWAGLASLRLGRKIPVLHLLAGVWLVVGGWQPAAAFDLGTQLSFSATGALLLAARPRAVPDLGMAARPDSFAARAGSLVRLSAVALGATAPWLAWRGISGGTAGLVVNVVAIPWTSGVLLPAALVGGLTPWMEDGVAQWVLGIGRSLAGLTLAGVTSLEGVLPPAAPVQGRPPVLALGMAGLLVFLACRASRTSVTVALCLSSVLWLRSGPVADPASPPPRVVMFDVGQGDALLVEGARSAVLVDAGRAIAGGMDLGRSVVVPGLAALGVEALDVVVVTHADLDHRGGIPAVLEAVPVGELWLPWQGSVDPAFGEVLRVARRRGVEIVETGRGGAARRIGDAVVTPLWPPRHGPPAADNARSLVLGIELSGWRLLLAGDIGDEVEDALVASRAALAADVLKVAHHGSASSSGEAFLRAVGPRALLLSAPCRPGGRLPHPRALARLRATSAVLGWTGRDGAVVVDLRADPGDSPVFSQSDWGGARPCGGRILGSNDAWRRSLPNP